MVELAHLPSPYLASLSLAGQMAEGWLNLWRAAYPLSLQRALRDLQRAQYRALYAATLAQ